MRNKCVKSLASGVTVALLNKFPTPNSKIRTRSTRTNPPINPHSMRHNRTASTTRTIIKWSTWCKWMLFTGRTRRIRTTTYSNWPKTKSSIPSLLTPRVSRWSRFSVCFKLTISWKSWIWLLIQWGKCLMKCSNRLHQLVGRITRVAKLKLSWSPSLEQPSKLLGTRKSIDSKNDWLLRLELDIYILLVWLKILLKIHSTNIISKGLF